MCDFCHYTWWQSVGFFDKNESYSTLSRPMSIYKCPAGKIVDLTVCGLAIISNFDSHGDYIIAIWDPDSDIVAYVDSPQWPSRNVRVCDEIYAMRHCYTIANVRRVQPCIIDHRLVLPNGIRDLTVFNNGIYRVYIYEVASNVWVTVTCCPHSGRHDILCNIHTPGNIDRVHCNTDYAYVSLDDGTLWKVPQR